MKFLTTVACARRAGLTPDGVRKATRRGQLRAIRAEGGVYIYREIDVERWLARRRRLVADAVLRAAGGDAA